MGVDNTGKMVSSKKADLVIIDTPPDGVGEDA